MIRRPAEHAAGGPALTRSQAFIRRLIPFAILLAVGACGGQSAPTGPTGVGSGPRTAYVSTTGNDRNAGTVDAPWLTLRYGVAQLHAGDTLYIRGGTYTGNANTIDSMFGTVPSGTSWSSPITIAGYGSEVATIQPPDTLQGIRLVGGQSYIVFQDFTIDMASETDHGTGAEAEAIYLSSGTNHIRFLRLDVKNSINSGFTFSDNNANAPFNEILSCKIHDNGRGARVNSGYGLYIETSDNLLDGNDVYNNGGYGLHFYNNAGPFNVNRNTIRNNSIHDNGTRGGTNYGIVVDWGDGNQIYNNMIYGNHGGILIYTFSSNIDVHNNTIHDNAPLEGILIQGARNAVIRDNIVYSNGLGVVDNGVGTTLSNNGT